MRQPVVAVAWGIDSGGTTAFSRDDQKSLAALRLLQSYAAKGQGGRDRRRERRSAASVRRLKDRVPLTR